MQRHERRLYPILVLAWIDCPATKGLRTQWLLKIVNYSYAYGNLPNRMIGKHNASQPLTRRVHKSPNFDIPDARKLHRPNVACGSQPEVSDGHENVGFRG
jgi:hypothetical protein